MTTMTTRTLEVPGATLTYDVHGLLPTADGAPVLVCIGQPMDSTGFRTLISFLPERTVVTPDPRGLGRSVRHDGGTEHRAEQQAEDLHRLVAALGAGPVELFGSSGGAVTALRLVETHPEDVRTCVAHEPPLIELLPDAEHVHAANQRVLEAYRQRGWGAGMAMFIAMTSWQGELTADVGRAAPDPAQLGLPTDDDGSRDDPLLSGVSNAVQQYRVDVAALAAAPTRVVVAAGIESKGIITWRASEILADRLGQELAVFPSNHGGFLGDEFGMPGQPEAFAARLREVLAGGA